MKPCGDEAFEVKYGDVTGDCPLGFKAYMRAGEPQFGRYYTVLLTKKQPVEFSVDFSLVPAVQKLSEFRFYHKF